MFCLISKIKNIIVINIKNIPKLNIIIVYLFNSSDLLFFSSALFPFFPFAKLDPALWREPFKEADDRVDAPKLIPLPSNCSSNSFSSPSLSSTEFSSDLEPDKSSNFIAE